MTIRPCTHVRTYTGRRTTWGSSSSPSILRRILPRATYATSRWWGTSMMRRRSLRHTPTPAPTHIPTHTRTHAHTHSHSYIRRAAHDIGIKLVALDPQEDSPQICHKQVVGDTHTNTHTRTRTHRAPHTHCTYTHTYACKHTSPRTHKHKHKHTKPQGRARHGHQARCSRP